MATIQLHDTDTEAQYRTLDIIDTSELDEAMWYDQSPTYVGLVTHHEETEGQGDVHVDDAYLARFLDEHGVSAATWPTENGKEYLVLRDANAEFLGAIELQVDNCIQWLEVLVALNY